MAGEIRYRAWPGMYHPSAHGPKIRRPAGPRAGVRPESQPRASARRPAAKAAAGQSNLWSLAGSARRADGPATDSASSWQLQRQDSEQFKFESEAGSLRFGATVFPATGRRGLGCMAAAWAAGGPRRPRQAARGAEARVEPSVVNFKLATVTSGPGSSRGCRRAAAAAAASRRRLAL